MQKLQLKSHHDKIILLSQLENQDFSKLYDGQTIYQLSKIKQGKSTSKSSTSTYQTILSVGSHRSLPQLIAQLQQNRISYNKNFDQQILNDTQAHQIRVLAMQTTRHYQVVELTLSLGPYTQILKIFNTFTPSILPVEDMIYAGKTTGIYRFKYDNLFYVAKSIAISKIIDNELLRRKQFLDILKEVFVSKMMSVLKIGPKLCNYFGFDIFMSETDAFFFIEELAKNANERTFDNDDTSTLKKSLIQMHELSILHRDIKPYNIMFSPSYRKYVFIDFGVSQFRKEKIGQLVLANFAGSYMYCTEEVKNLFQQSQKRWVNLHLNDAYGLQLSIEEMQNRRLHFYNQDQNESQETISDFLTQVKIKNLLLVERYSEKPQFQKIQKLSQESFVSILNFLYQIPLTEGIRKLYNNHMEERAKFYTQFSDLREIFSRKIYFESCKGTRKLFSIMEKNYIKQKEKFYGQIIKISGFGKDKLAKPSIQTLEQILLDYEKISNLQPNNYEMYLIEYLNFKRIKQTVPLSSKRKVCQMYLKLKNIQFLSFVLRNYDTDTDQNSNLRNQDNKIFGLVFHDILASRNIKWKVSHYLKYLKLLENYFIVTSNLDIKIIIQISSVVNLIEEDNVMTISNKIQYLLSIYFPLFFVTFKIAQTSAYSELVKLDYLIQEKVKTLCKIQCQDAEIKQKLKVYLSCLKYFLLDKFLLKKQALEITLEEIVAIKPKQQYQQILLDFICYRFLLQLQFIGENYFKIKQKEERILQDIQENSEINICLLYIIDFYFQNKDQKMLQNILGIFKNCLLIESVFNEYFVHVQIFIYLNSHNSEQIISRQNQMIEKTQPIIKAWENVSYEMMIKFVKQTQKFISIIVSRPHFKVPTPQICIKIISAVQKLVPEYLILYESLKSPIVYRGSESNFYLELLNRSIQNQLQQNLNYLEFEKGLKNLPFLVQIFETSKLKSFQKIISLDRSKFTQIDHAFLMVFDIINIFQIQLQEEKIPNEKVLSYIEQRKSGISSMLSFEKSIVKATIIAAFRIVFYIWNSEHNIACQNQDFTQISLSLDVIRKGLELIYPLVQRNFIILGNALIFTELIITALIKVSKFQQIFNQIHVATIFYNHHLSKANLHEIFLIYYTIINRVSQNEKDYQFYTYLKHFITQIDFQKTPVFAIFLLFCIRPFNRKALLKIITKCLNFINYDGKFFILSIFYKEFLKLSSNISNSKKLSILKKDIRYPSEFMFNLQVMKHQMINDKKLAAFKCVFLKTLQNKIKCLGKCCEVYSEQKGQKNPFAQIFANQVFYQNRKKNQTQVFRMEEW